MTIDATRAPEGAEPPDPPVAIVGVGALYPGSTSSQGFWGDLVAGRDRITEVPPTHWRIEDYFDPDPATPDKIYARRGGFLPAIDFSPLHFGIPPASLPAIDSAQLLALAVAERVIADMAGRAFARVDRDRISVILGVASATELVAEMVGRLQRPRWERALRAAGLAEADVQRVSGPATEQYVPWQESTFPGLLGNVVSGRIANRLDLGGSNYVVDAACGSSLAAVESALNELYLRRADLVITGGVDALNDVLMFSCFSRVGALSPSGACRPFADGADGTLLGEGVGMFALKRLADAERDGDHVYAVIRGMGTSSDRRALSIYAPRPEGQAKALASAYARAGYGPESVELVEAHGTGTRAGDLAEVEALRRVFGTSGRGTRWCALGSVKSQIGHTKAAAGAAGLFKAAMALHHGVLPPTINVERPDPRLGLDESPFYLNTRARPWLKPPGTPRRAAVSSFGFGGTNFHLTLEEYDGPAPRPPRLRAVPSELLLVGAADREGLAGACRALARRLAEPRAAPDAIARETHAGFSARAEERLALVVADAAEGARALERAAAAIAGGDAVEVAGAYHGRGDVPGKLAFVFPGQGSQYVGMGGDLAMHFEVARRVWDAAAGVEADGAADFTRSVYPPPAFDAAGADAHERALRATDRAQPAIATASWAATALLRTLGVEPALAAGHSLGELTALAAAGVFDLGALLSAAATRGRAMAQAANGGPSTMTAVFAAPARVEEILRAAAPDVVVANHNAPEQMVLSGETAAVERAERALGAAGVRCTRLAVGAGFHSPSFAEAAGTLAEFLAARALRAPALPVYSHVTAAPYGSDPAAVPAQLGRAVVSPVRFLDQVEALYAAGARVFVEPGPDRVLTRLVGACLRDRPHVAVALDRRDAHGVTSLWHALGALAAAGVVFDTKPLWEGQVLSSDLERAPDATTVRISGANYGKRYPGTEEEGEIVAAPPARPAVTPTPPAAPAAPERSAPIASGVPPDGWLDAFTALQQQTAAAHADFQRLLAERHAAFLQASTEGLRQLAALAGAAPLGVEPLPVAAARAATAWPAPAVPADLMTAPPPPAAARPVQPAPAPAPAPVVAAPPPPASRSDLLLDIVAEKTGYPREALDLGMDMESDLGIDSIKRVEILAAMTDRIPDLPQLQTERLVAMRTLAQIASFIDASAPAAGPAPAPSAAPPASPPARAPSRSDLLLDIVAEKTGYPREALDLGMDMESDLGIDSIKRVEILAAMTDRIPDLPQLQTERLVSMRTLAQIAAHIDGAGGGGGSEGAPAVTTSGAPAAAPVPIERRVPVLHDAPAPGFAVADLWDGEPLFVLGGGGGVGGALVARLAREGIAAEAVEAPPPAARRVVLLANPTAASIDEALAIDRGLLSVVAGRARVWEQGGGLLVAVEHAEDAWLGGLAALCRTARGELPGLTTTAIRLERGAYGDADAVADAIVAELVAGGAEPEVELGAGGRRRRARLEPRPVVAGELPFEAGAVVVASGGGRGITGEALIALAQRVELRLLVLGRTPLADEPEWSRGVEDPAELSRLVLRQASARGESRTPAEVRAEVGRVVAAREVGGIVARLRAAGSEVRYAALDVADARAVAAAVDEARRDWGPIAGVVHGAGALADAWLRDKTEAHVERVFAPKLRGLASLLAATAADPLRLVCAFSSIAAHAGNPGQADYAMANALVERVLAAEAARRGPSCVVRALAWGPWDGGMVTPHLREKFARDGVGLIGREAGGAAFLRELAGSGTDATVVLAAAAPDARAPSPAPEGTLVVAATRASHPQLADHRIGGRVVLPMALVVEWCARLVRALDPGASHLRLDDLQVLRPIVLPDRDGPASRLLLRHRRDADGRTVRVELSGADGTPCYRGTLVLDARAEPLPPLTDEGASAASAGAVPTSLYGEGALFHGPGFHVLRDVDAVTATSARARIATTAAMGWPGTYLAEPALVDGALQLALVWALEAKGQRCVPMRIGAVRVALASDPPAVVDGTLAAPQLSGATLRAGVRVADDAGAVLVELRGVEVHPIPADAAPRAAVAATLEA